MTKKQDQQILNLQVKSLLKDTENSRFYVKSEQPDPTLYISFLPQFCAEIKEKQKGIVFIGQNFIVGLCGTKDMVALEEVEKYAHEVSSKAVKVMKKDKVSFKFKEKGKKPIEAKDVCQFMISGADFPVDKVAELLKGQQFMEMD